MNTFKVAKDLEKSIVQMNSEFKEIKVSIDTEVRKQETPSEVGFVIPQIYKIDEKSQVLNELRDRDKDALKDQSPINSYRPPPRLNL